MNVVDIIRAKRDGARLSDEQLRWFIDAYTKGEVADEQAAALCMAIYFNGMQPGELAVWTQAMIDSGERLDLSAVGRPTVDKHSTGASATRSRSCLRRSSPRAVPPCPSSRGGVSDTAGERSTSSRRLRGGGRH